MAVYVSCTACNAPLEIDDEHAGWRVRCPKCQAVFLARGTPAAALVPAGGGSGSQTPPWQTTSPPPALSIGAAAPAPETPAWPVPATPLPAAPWAAPVPPPPPPPVPAPGTRVPNSGLAVASVVLGILGLACFGWLAAIPGIICGVKARKQIRESRGAVGGENIAKAGLAISILALVVSVGDFDAWNPWKMFKHRKAPIHFNLDD
ncbi:MAG: DUF4190 domain-containing protein [Planctomycetes bacterium]|nr:DUF4190 domain-containing protein [Planctomycetota bacterium]